MGTAEYLVLWLEVQAGTVTMEISTEVPQEAETQPDTKHSYTTLGHVPKGLNTLLRTHTCPFMLILALFITTRSWKQLDHLKCGMFRQ